MLCEHKILTSEDSGWGEGVFTFSFAPWIVRSKLFSVLTLCSFILVTFLKNLVIPGCGFYLQASHLKAAWKLCVHGQSLSKPAGPTVTGVGVPRCHLLSSYQSSQRRKRASGFPVWFANFQRILFSPVYCLLSIHTCAHVPKPVLLRFSQGYCSGKAEIVPW